MIRLSGSRPFLFGAGLCHEPVFLLVAPTLYVDLSDSDVLRRPRTTSTMIIPTIGILPPKTATNIVGKDQVQLQ